MALKILVVDGGSFIRDLVKKQLRDHLPGVEIFEAADGIRAMVVLKHNPIDLILSDWEMPQMTGDDLLRAVRASPEGASTPFIMITSRGDRDHVVVAVKAGVSDYLTKPFSAEELLTKVHKQLKLIGKMPSFQNRQAATQGIAGSSVGVLTGGRPSIADPKTAAPSVSALMAGSAALLTGSPAAAKPAPAKSAKAQAQLRFANNLSFACVVREMSLQVMSCVLQRADQLPQVFDQAVVDIDMGEGKGLARVNGYVHSIMAGESRPDSSIVKIVIRFVDNDVDKFEILSKFIEQM
jgi:CheY-like chemotaxis protein